MAGVFLLLWEHGLDMDPLRSVVDDVAFLRVLFEEVQMEQIIFLICYAL